VSFVDLVFLPEPDEWTRRAVAAALARFPVAIDPSHLGYASRWRLAGLAEAVQSGWADDEECKPGGYGCSPRIIRGVTRA
jgi:hypothetical protein